MVSGGKREGELDSHYRIPLFHCQASPVKSPPRAIEKSGSSSINLHTGANSALFSKGRRGIIDLSCQRIGIVVFRFNLHEIIDLSTC